MQQPTFFWVCISLLFLCRWYRRVHTFSMFVVPSEIITPQTREIDNLFGVFSCVREYQIDSGNKLIHPVSSLIHVFDFLWVGSCYLVRSFFCEYNSILYSKHEISSKRFEITNKKLLFNVQKMYKWKWWSSSLSRWSMCNDYSFNVTTK